MTKSESLASREHSAGALDDWLTRRGLWGNPFERWSAEGDHDLPSYFVEIDEFDELLRLATPCVVFARRGCGKTAQRQMLAAHCRPLKEDSSRLALVYTFSGFERVLDSVDGDVERIRSIHHVRALLHLGLTAFESEATRDPGLAGVLMSQDVASRLASYEACFAPHLAGASADGKSDSLGNLGSLELMQGFSELIQGTGLDSCVVLVDGVDEFPQTAGDPSYAVAFLAPVLGTLALIDCPGWAFAFFLPEGLKPALYDCRWFRPDRLRVDSLSWSDSDLLALIRQRLIHFSNREPPYEDLAQLCEDDLAQVINKELTESAGRMPRAALILADMLLQSHCQDSDPPVLIALETWRRVKEKWQERQGDFRLEEAQDVQREVADSVPTPAFVECAFPLLRIEEGKGLVWLGEQEIRKEIKPKDYSVLLSLNRHTPDVCSKDLIAQEAWPEAISGEGVSDQAIAASIARLRKVLAKFAPNRNYIETVRGRVRTEGGYRLYPEGCD